MRCLRLSMSGRGLSTLSITTVDARSALQRPMLACRHAVLNELRGPTWRFSTALSPNLFRPSWGRRSRMWGWLAPRRGPCARRISPPLRPRSSALEEALQDARTGRASTILTGRECNCLTAQQYRRNIIMIMLFTNLPRRSNLGFVVQWLRRKQTRATPVTQAVASRYGTCRDELGSNASHQKADQ